MRDLVALSTLPSVWINADSAGVVRGLAEVLTRLLSLDLVYVRVEERAGRPALEAARTRHRTESGERTSAIGHALEPWLRREETDLPGTIANPVGDGTIRLMVFPIGHDQDHGLLAAGCSRPDFPTDTERLLLGVAVNQAAGVFQRKESEWQLLRSERELSDFFENASVGLHWVGADGTIVRVNQAELDLLGYSLPEYVGRSIAEFHADKDVIADILRRLAVGEAIRDYEARMVCKDGSIKHVRIDSSALMEGDRLVHTRCFTRDVTDRRRAEETLRKQSEWLRVTLASIGDAVITTDTEGRVTSMNPVAQALTGWSEEEGRGRPLDDVFRVRNELTGQPVENPAARALRAGAIVGLANHTLLVGRDGSERAIDDSAAPIQDDEGTVLGVVLIFRDVTDGRRAVESRLLLSAIVESSEDAIISRDLDGTIVSWNKGAERLYGYTADEVIGRPLAMLVPPDHPDELPDLMERLARGERVEHFETVRLRKDGGRVDVSLTISPVRDAEGRIVGASKIARDITEQKREEQRTRFLADASASLAELTDFESTLQRIAALAVPAFADLCAVDVPDADGSVRRLAITCADPAKEKAVEDLRRFPPRPTDGAGIMKVLRTGVAEWRETVPDSVLQEIAQGGEHLRVLRDLGLKSYICVPLLSRARMLGVLSFAMAESGRSYRPGDLRAAEDLASRAAIAVENASLLAALRESDQRKDEFLAVLAHELRNPLAPVRNALQLLQLKGPPTPELQWARQVIDRQVHQMTHLVDDLLDVSRIRSGKIELRRERVELATVVHSAVETSRPLIEKWGHELTVSIPPEPIYLDADVTRLSQVLLNLLNNAGKYTEPGGRIALLAERDGDQVLIRVKDTGIGIPQQMLTRIFDMFTQIGQPLDRSQGGLGIGLTLVKRLTEIHGGSVEARSPGPGKGSEFILRLPMADHVESPEPLQAASEERASTPSSRILVVDDSVDAAESLAMLLRFAGHQVETAHDGLAAVEAASRFQPDIVLLDIGLPKMNGYDAGRRIREAQGDGVILIALTGWGQDQDRLRSKEAGFDHHMTKPISFDALQDLLARTAALRAAPGEQRDSAV